MGEISGSLCVSLTFTEEEDVEIRNTFPVGAKVEGSLHNSY